MQTGDILEGRGLFPRRFIVDRITEASVFVTELQWMDEAHPGCMQRLGGLIRCKKRKYKDRFYLMLPKSKVIIKATTDAEIKVI